MSKIGRNEPCPCGSGLKYKKCCFDQDTIDAYNAPGSVQYKTLQNNARHLLKDNAKIVYGKEVGLVEMSAIILEFIEEFHYENDTPDDIHKLLDIGIIAWNMALIDDETTRDVVITNYLSECVINKSRIEEVKNFVQILINKKIEQYPEIKRKVLNYQVQKTKSGKLNLQVMSTVL